MAEKMANSIGRELRYFEYKLRKKQSTKKNKKGKDQGPRPELAWSDGLKSDDYRHTSEEMTKAAPANRGEEDLQIQVALAMSREEEKERERQQESDKIRLEMAMKESAKSTGKPSTANQPTLLDLSAERPARVSAPVPSVGGSAPFASAATNDPWGTGTTAPSAPTFDPFAPVTAQTQAMPVATDGFGMQNGNAWATPAAAPPGNNLDMWGSSATFGATAAPTAAAAFPPPQQANPWGAPQPTVSQVQAQPVYATVQKDAWSNDPFLSGQPMSNVAAPTSQPIQNGNAWGGAATTQPAAMDPFGGSAAPATTASMPFSAQQSFETPPAFDPLKDFDALRIGNRQSEPSPILLHKDFSATSSVAKDIFPVAQILEPQQAGKPQQEAGMMQPQTTQNMTTASTKDQFLGENANLVNFNSWQTYQIPYVTKPLGTVSHNPFAQTGPQKTLNEMKSSSQQPFAQPAFH